MPESRTITKRNKSFSENSIRHEKTVDKNNSSNETDDTKERKPIRTRVTRKTVNRKGKNATMDELVESMKTLNLDFTKDSYDAPNNSCEASSNNPSETVLEPTTRILANGVQPDNYDCVNVVGAYNIKCKDSKHLHCCVYCAGSESLTDCIHCYDSRACYGCKYLYKDCENLHDCFNCVNCKNSKDLFQCTNCELCYSSTACTGCTSCNSSVGLHNCKNCYSCINCTNCINCINCINCDNLENEENKMNIKNPIKY